MVICALVISAFSLLAQEAPPSLENHQFYGAVHWDKTAKDPVTVVAKVGTNSFSAVIKKESCGEKTCSGSYGKDADNILRVQASAGATIQFYLDTVKLPLTSVYKAGEVTILDLNVATSPVEKPGCVADWKCSEWSVCSAGKQARSCTDANQCDPDKLKKSETQGCGAGMVQKTAADVLECSYQWDCTDWSACVGGQQTRACEQIDDCDSEFAAGTVSSVAGYSEPAELQTCVVGLGGSLPLKAAGATAGLPKSTLPSVKEDVSEQAGLSLWVYAGIVVILLGMIGLWLVLRKRSAGPPQY